MSRRSYNAGITDMRLPNAVQDYDGNWYDAVLLGEQVWLGSNLRTKHYADGTAIADGLSRMSETDKYYYSNTASSMNISYRGLCYNPAAIMNDAQTSTVNPSGVQGVAMTGWHVPSSAEFQQLIDYLQSKRKYWYGYSESSQEKTGYTAKAITSNGWWNESTNQYAVGGNMYKTNGAAFLNIYASGSIMYNSSQNRGVFIGENISASFATSQRCQNGTTCYTFTISYNDTTPSIIANGWGELRGHSVRCVCDMNSKQFLKWYLQQYGTLNHQIN